MNNSNFGNSSTSELNLLSRPSRVKKKRYFENFVTSTPLPPPKKTKYGALASFEEDKLSNSSAGSLDSDKSGNMSLGGKDKLTSSSQKMVKLNSTNRSRPRGRQRKNKLPENSLGDESLNSSSNIELGDASVDCAEEDCSLRLTNNDSEVNFGEELKTNSSRGRGRPRGRPRKLSSTPPLSRSQNSFSHRGSDVGIADSKDEQDQHSKSLSSDHVNKMSDKLEGTVQSVSNKRGRGRPRKVSYDVMSKSGNDSLDSYSITNKDNDYDEQEGLQRRSSRTSRKQKFSSGDSSGSENETDDDNHFIDDDSSRVHSIRGRGRGRPRGRGGVARSSDKPCEDFEKETKKKIDEKVCDASLESSFITNKNNDDAEQDISQRQSSLEGKTQSVSTKRGRGRPKKVSYDVMSRFGNDSLDSSSITNKDNDCDEQVSQRRLRRMPQKQINSFDDLSGSENGPDDDFIDDGSSRVHSKRGRVRRRPRGRGRLRGRGGVARKSDKPGEDSDDLSESENGTEDDDDDYIVNNNRIHSVRGRGRGRPRGRGRGSVARSIDRPGDDSKDLSQDYHPPPKEFKCSHCEETLSTYVKFQYHLMTKHSLVATDQCPEGESNAHLIIHKNGFVSCQKCQRKFKNPQYYRHHIIWCGRENEMYLCSLCNKNTKKMWEYHHLQYHKRVQEEKKEVETKQLGDETEMDKDFASGQKRSVRNAAKSALTLISGLHEGVEMDPGTDIKRKRKKKEEADYDGSGINEDDNDDDDDNEESLDEENEDDENIANDNKKPPSSKKKTKMKHSKGAEGSKRRFRRAQNGENDFVWKILSGYDIQKPSANYATHFYKELKRKESLFLFEDIVPRVTDWIPLHVSDRAKYLPSLRCSAPFTSIRKGCKPIDPLKLPFGESATVNGKHFSFTGGPIWAMDWCPLPWASRHPEVLALFADRHQEPQHGMAQPVSEPSLIQFWTMDKEQPAKLSFGIGQDSGHVRSMMWCPAGGFSPKVQQKSGPTESMDKDSPPLDRLGLLAVACSDSSVLIYSIPQLSRLFPTQSTADSENQQGKGNQTLAVFRPPPTKLVFNSTAQASPCLCVSWQDSDQCQYILGGFGGGEIAMWDLMSKSSFIRVDANTLRPMRVFCRHGMSVLCVSWCPSLPTQFASGSYDGVFQFWDKDRPYEPIVSMKKGTRGPVRAISWASPFHAGFFTIDDKRRVLVQNEKVRSNYTVTFHGLSLQCMDNSDSHTLVYNTADAAWDLTFQPLYELMASCDTTGNIIVNLPLMHQMRRTRKHDYRGLLKKNMLMTLYRIKCGQPLSKVMPKVSEADVDHQTNQSTESVSPETTNEKTVSSIRDLPEHSATKKGGDDDEQEVLYFSECRQHPSELDLVQKGSKKLKVDLNDKEDLMDSNMSAIYRVRLNPSLSKNIWLASGGQTGLLRLDNLVSWVAPHRSEIHSELKSLERSKKGSTATS